MNHWTIIAFCLLSYAFGVFVKDQDEEFAEKSALILLFVALVILTVRITIFFNS